MWWGFNNRFTANLLENQPVKKILAPRVWFLPFYGTRCILAINIDRWVTTSLGYIDTAFCSNEVINILYKLMYVQFILVYMPKVNESVQCIHQHKRPGTFVEIGLCMQTGLRYNYDICLILSPRIRPPGWPYARYKCFIVLYSTTASFCAA